MALTGPHFAGPESGQPINNVPEEPQCTILWYQTDTGHVSKVPMAAIPPETITHNQRMMA